MAQRLDSTGAVKSSDLYNAYGKRLLGGGASGDPYGFGGQMGYYTDGETGLALLGQRFYDPGVSRFLTRDPLGYAGGLKLSHMVLFFLVSSRHCFVSASAFMPGRLDHNHYRRLCFCRRPIITRRTFPTFRP